MMQSVLGLPAYAVVTVAFDERGDIEDGID